MENKRFIFIAGDLNCNLSERERSTCMYMAKLLVLNIYLLKQHIQSPTRVTVNYYFYIDDNKTIDSGVVELYVSVTIMHLAYYLCRKLVRNKRQKLYLVDSLKILMLTSFRKRYNINANIIRDDPNRC